MYPRDFFARAELAVRRRLGQKVRTAQFELASAEGLEAKTDLARLFVEHRGRVVRKWAHYPDLYDRHFAPFRDHPIGLLEIGVSEGGSLELWRSYFGASATIFGIDITQECAERVDPPNQVRIGSQDDPVFLQSVVNEMGQPDIIIDDGSHIGRHQTASFEALFPLLAEGGLYVIEDTHTAYWPGIFEGGYKRRGTAIELVKSLLDDLHGWWHNKPAQDVRAIHAYDSIIFIEKGERPRPSQVRVG